MRPRPRRPLRLLPPIAALALLVAPLSAQERAAARPGDDEYVESIEVVETSVLLESARKPVARDLLLLEGGVAREVVRVERIERDEPWELLVWIDGALCEQAPLESTLLGVARRARELTRLGRVRVLIAGEATVTEAVATRETDALQAVLARLSAQELCHDQASRLFWEAREAGTAAAGEAAMVRLRGLVAARAELLTAATGACPAGACAVLLVAHGYPLQPDLWMPAAMRPGTGPELSAGLAADTAALARSLAVARWMVLALPFAAPSTAAAEEDDALPREARPGPDAFPRSPDDRPPPAWRVWPPPGRVARREQVRAALASKAWEVYLLPELAPLRRLADTTAGLVLRVPEQLAGALEVLAGRWRVWYRTVPFAAGESRQLEVLVGDPPVRAAAPAWVGAPPATPAAPPR